MTPAKLKHDAILEAVFEIRFQCGDLPEIVVGRLADRNEWKSFTKSDLPIANIPAQIRRGDQNLRFEPIILLQSPVADRLARIGEQSVSLHVLAPYCGWKKFQDELIALNEWMFSHLTDLKVIRLGLRYIDALRSDIHGIANLSSLNLRVSVADRDVNDKFMLHFYESTSKDHELAVRISSKDLVVGSLPESTSVVTDIDVYSSEGRDYLAASDVSEWLEAAHNINKGSFFGLLPKEVLDALTEA